MEGRPRISHPLSSYIEVAKDKSGAARTLLRIPYWARVQGLNSVEFHELNRSGPGLG